MASTCGATHADGTLVSATAPVTPGETLVIYMTGLGQMDGKIGAGHAAPLSPPPRVLAPVQVQIGATMPIALSLAGFPPGFVGVCQVNVAVPQDLRDPGAGWGAMLRTMIE